MNGVPTESPEELQECDNVFTVSKSVDDIESKIDIEVKCVKISGIIDSGATVNIDRGMWEYLKKHKINYISQLTNRKLYHKRVQSCIPTYFKFKSTPSIS